VWRGGTFAEDEGTDVVHLEGDWAEGDAAEDEFTGRGFGGELNLAAEAASVGEAEPVGRGGATGGAAGADARGEEEREDLGGGDFANGGVLGADGDEIARDGDDADVGGVEVAVEEDVGRLGLGERGRGECGEEGEQWGGFHFWKIGR
jgi:hypothetical protein